MPGTGAHRRSIRAVRVRPCAARCSRTRRAWQRSGPLKGLPPKGRDKLCPAPGASQLQARWQPRRSRGSQLHRGSWRRAARRRLRLHPPGRPPPGLPARRQYRSTRRPHHRGCSNSYRRGQRRWHRPRMRGRRVSLHPSRPRGLPSTRHPRAGSSRRPPPQASRSLECSRAPGQPEAGWARTRFRR